MIRIENDVLGMCATNTYYAYNDSTKEVIIVDPAYNADRIAARIDASGYKPVGILITHGHFDHILAVDELRKKYSIKAYAGLTEKAVLTNPVMNLTSGGFLDTPITCEADVYLKDGETFLLGGYSIKAIETPGHTIGGMCFYIEAENMLFSGDTLFCQSVGRTDFPGGSSSMLIKSIKEKLFCLPEGTKVYPGHEGTTTIGYEKEYNYFVS